MSKSAGFLTPVLELVLSAGGYYLLRACGAGVFWALVGPAALVAVVAVAATVRRRRADLLGLLVLAEIAATLTLSLVTQSPRVAALREVAYIGVAGVFCLATLLRAAPLTHQTAASVASFGDPKRVRAFERAWRDVPRYRAWQRLLTASLGLIMIVAAVVRAVVLLTAPESGLPHAVDVSTTLGLVMIGVLVATSAVLIQPPRRIIERLAGQEQDVR